MKNIILAAGKAKKELSVLIPPGKNKVLLRILGKPVIYYPLRSLQEASGKETIIVYRRGEEQVIDEAGKYSKHPIVPIAQEKGETIRDAILVASKELEKENHFFLVFGDIIIEPEALIRLYNTHLTEEPDATILLVPYDPEYAETYGIATIDEEGYLTKILTNTSANKPKYIIGGAYILPNHILDLLEKNMNLPEAINQLIQEGAKIKTVLWTGTWIDIGYPADLLEADYALLSMVKSSIISDKAEIEPTSTIIGPVIIEENTYIDHHVLIKGPVYIGKNSFIGAHSFIRQYTDINNNVRIGAYNEVKKSNIQPYTLLDSYVYLADSIIGENSIIGAYTITLNVLESKMKPPRIRKHLVSPPKKEVKKLGAIIGYNTKIGTKTTIYPGKTIKPESIIEPNGILK
ncbi:MAG: NTP transferase domain-containing protein [Staphylothermus sp.]|nr:NTP transferase domain-containing protein [Staphylothermus sp.]